MTRFFWVCLAGAAGTGVRYAVAQLAVRVFGYAFPWGTLLVNLVGCFLMSMVGYAGIRSAISPELRLVLATGFMGGLTTYSAFNWETMVLAHQRTVAVGLLNFGATVGGCLVAGLLGLALARALFGA